MGPKVAKLVSSAQIWTLGPLKSPLLRLRNSRILKGPKYPKSLHKLVLPENGSKIDFGTVILGEMGPKAVFRSSNRDILVRKWENHIFGQQRTKN